MNEAHLASIVLGVVAGFYSTIFLLCLSDVVYLSKEMSKMKGELAHLRHTYSNQTLFPPSSPMNDSGDKDRSSSARRTLSGRFCLSYNEQRQILDYVNFMCNMAILAFGSYSIYVHGLGTQHGLTYRFVFFLLKIVTVIASIWLHLHFKQGLPSDIFLYMWIDVNCIASIFRSIRQAV